MGLFSRLIEKVKSGSTSTQDFAEIEKSLIQSDLGAANAKAIIELAKKNRDENSIMEALRSWMSQASRDLVQGSSLQTILVVGVNGTGKTTSTAKLAALLKENNKKVILAAADTFRAAAISQLKTWGERLEIPVVAGIENGDPASVAFDSVKKAQSEGFEYLIVDTAGRLHTKSGLMDELTKIKRVIEKSSPVTEVLLVVDATTGQNGITQAKVFLESVQITGLILTKMDGSAKGGVALAIEKELGVPIKFIGTGEFLTDLAPFEPESYLKALL